MGVLSVQVPAIYFDQRTPRARRRPLADPGSFSPYVHNYKCVLLPPRASRRVKISVSFKRGPNRVTARNMRSWNFDRMNRRNRIDHQFILLILFILSNSNTHMEVSKRRFPRARDCGLGHGRAFLFRFE
jgi:hypothetical protein